MAIYWGWTRRGEVNPLSAPEIARDHSNRLDRAWKVVN